MPNPMDVISSLQNILFLQNEITKDNDDLVDVPFVDDDEYVTHRSIGEIEKVEEQEKEEDPPLEAPEEVTPEASPEMEPEEPMPEDPDAMGDAMGGDMGANVGGDMGMGGMPGEEKEEPLTPGQIGRIYELKKIYSRLLALENILQDVTEPEMIEIRNIVSKAIELFKTLSDNFDIYKERLDDIIVIFYKFLEISYNKTRDYFKQNQDKEV